MSPDVTVGVTRPNKLKHRTGVWTRETSTLEAWRGPRVGPTKSEAFWAGGETGCVSVSSVVPSITVSMAARVGGGGRKVKIRASWRQSRERDSRLPRRRIPAVECASLRGGDALILGVVFSDGEKHETAQSLSAKPAFRSVNGLQLGTADTPVVATQKRSRSQPQRLKKKAILQLGDAEEPQR